MALGRALQAVTPNRMKSCAWIQLSRGWSVARLTNDSLVIIEPFEPMHFSGPESVSPQVPVPNNERTGNGVLHPSYDDGWRRR